MAPAIPGAENTSSTEDAMTTDDGRVATQFPVPERYRAAILSAGGFAVAVLLLIADLGGEGRPLGGIEFVNVALGAGVLAATYWPANPWVKIVSGVAGALLQTIASGWTDGRFTTAEWVTIVTTLITALMVGAFPNAPELVTGEVGDDVPDEPADLPKGSTYMPPVQREGF